MRHHWHLLACANFICPSCWSAESIIEAKQNKALIFHFFCWGLFDEGERAATCWLLPGGVSLESMGVLEKRPLALVAFWASVLGR
jgi:hypothetical protein